MFSAFKARRPWAVALIFLIFGPFLGMLYLNRGLLSLIYLVLGFLAASTAILIFSPAFLTYDSGWLIELPVNTAGLIHGVLVARRKSVDEMIRWYAHWWFVFSILPMLLIVLLGVRTFLFQPFDLPSASMAPSLNVGDYFLVSKFVYNNRDPQRGDIVVFKMLNADSPDYMRDFVKRVVGLPGDRIQMINGQIFLNGRPVPKDHAGDFLESNPYGNVNSVPQYREALPGGKSYYVLDRIPDGPSDNTELVTVPPATYFVL